MSILSKLQKHLTAARLRFDVVRHKKVFTAYDLGQTLKLKLSGIAKTLLVKVDRPTKVSDDPSVVKATRHLLAVVPAHLRLDFVKIKKLVGAKKVSIASEGEMAKVLKVAPGAQTPFGTFHKLRVVMDRSLLKVPKALFGAGSFTESLRMNVRAYHRHERPLTGDITSKK